ncbi:Transcription factor AP-4 [Armadillidium nasatum]|uniref:Transcription factor AP-4 n=1 Tax=Armadillidium nasatum TaxID=96803 RepID=A0A5N5T7N6_9CRUS|nr:Transcription factor AP-4 [Armadillidium nasatum]
MEHEKRIRREIANSNERRRMQSINAGFASLKTLLPHHEGEKLSKAAILQQTAEYIYQLEQEKTRLISQNCHLKRLLNIQNSDNEGSPTGGNSPNEDRTLSTSSPPPSNVTSTTLGTPTSTTTANSGSDSDDLRKEVIERRPSEKERRHRSFDTDLYTEKVKEISARDQVKIEYRSVETQKKSQQQHLKIEIKREDDRGVCLSPPMAATTTVVTTTEPKVPKDHSDYADVREIHLQKSNGTAPQRITFPIASPANGYSPAEIHNGATFRTTTHTQGSTKALPPVLELRGLSEVHENGGTSPPSTVEYVEDTTVSSLGHTVYIVNSGSSSCQKSLDTICEAIRHLEGDHMFPLEEQSVSDIKEEVVTDETYTVDEDQVHHTVPQDLHHTHHRETVVTTGSYESQSRKGGSSPTIHSTHPLGGSMGHLTLHMLPPEPQEVPLELTTTHRTNNSEQQYVNHEVVCSSPQHVISHPAAILHHTSRPGVIVVKQQ